MLAIAEFVGRNRQQPAIGRDAGVPVTARGKNANLCAGGISPHQLRSKIIRRLKDDNSSSRGREARMGEYPSGRFQFVLRDENAGTCELKALRVEWLRDKRPAADEQQA